MDPQRGPVFVAGLAGVARSVGSQSVIGQLRGWGFNLLLPPVAEGFCNRGLPHVAVLELAKSGDRMLRQAGVALPDVFDPRWEEAVRQRVSVEPATAGLAAYVADTELRWGGEAKPGEAFDRPSLLQVCLSLDPVHAAYHAAWEFVLATRPGGVSDLVRDWAVTLPNKETLRQMTADDQVLDSPAFRIDHERFLREFCQRYHRVVGEALKTADGTRLWLSAPLSATTPAVVRSTAAAQVDVALVSEPGLGGGWTPELIWGVDGSGWSGQRSVLDPAALSDLERQLARTRETLLAWSEQPQVVGYVWSRYAGGDVEADGPGLSSLLDDNGRINHARVDPLAAFNKAAAALRGAVG